MKIDNTKPDLIDSTVLVIFGVTGDLTYRKLIPAVFQIWKEKKLPKEFCIMGFARRDWNHTQLQQTFINSILDSEKGIKSEECLPFVDCSQYIQSDFNDSKGYDELYKRLVEKSFRNILFYIATPPDSYSLIIENISKAKLHLFSKGWTRIVVEKPYGKDLKSALCLENLIHKVFREEQIFRIDHYLGKETVQNILVLRFANGIFEPLWNRHYIDHIQITVAETVGVGTRAGYYDGAGVIRDMFQNHLLQLVSLTAMEAPISFNSESVRDEKMKVLKSLRPYKENGDVTAIRAQYGANNIGGEMVNAYRSEQGVNSHSVTETFLAARLFVDNWRWAGVPFYIRSGKRLPKRITEIAIHFRQVPLSLFNWHNMAGDAPNVLAIQLQPDEGISLSIGAKKPGPVNQISPVQMNFSYEKAFNRKSPDAYQRLLLDCISGDATLFTRADEVQAQWEFTTSILEAWRKESLSELPQYPAGTWGPLESDELIQNSGRKWRFI